MRITLRNIVLVCLLLLSAAACAISFEVQVPMSSRPQQPMQMQQPLTNGHFQTSVHAVDAYGHAYAPGQTYNPTTTSGPRRIDIGGGGGLPPDPYEGEAAPIGEIPFIFFGILLIAYVLWQKRDKMKALKGKYMHFFA